MSFNLASLSPQQFLTTLITLLSSLRPTAKQLTPQEVELLTTFLLLPTKFSSYPFSTPGKKKVASILSLSPQTLHARIYSLLKKGFLRKDEDDVILLPPKLTSALSTFLTTEAYEFITTFTLDTTKDYSDLSRDFPPD